jgi:hypothetical protein
MPAPLACKKIIKKRTKRFVRFESEDFGKLRASWRRPRGIDNRVRRRFRGQRSMPKCGFGSDKVLQSINLLMFRKLNSSCLQDSKNSLSDAPPISKSYSWIIEPMPENSAITSPQESKPPSSKEPLN